MSEHDALRLAGRAGGELNEGDIVRLLPRRACRPSRCHPDRRPGRRASASSLNNSVSPACSANVPMRSSDPALGVDVRVAELARDSQELVTMLVADAGRDRHRDDAAEDRRPEGIDELFVVGRAAGSACRRGGRRCAAGDTGCRARAHTTRRTRPRGSRSRPRGR